MKYKVIFCYDGSKFYGSQKQNNYLTVQGVIEKALFKLNGNKYVQFVMSGRTDRAVHAKKQVGHFVISIPYNEDKLINSLNYLCGDYIFFKEIKLVDVGFCARRMAKKRKYNYYINMGEYNVFHVDYIYQLNKILDVERMEGLISSFIGKKDFTVFSKSDCENKVRTIYSISLEVTNNIMCITFMADGFLRHMIRCIVGCLIDAGTGKDVDVLKIFETGDKNLLSPVVSGCGLYLEEVYY